MTLRHAALLIFAALFAQATPGLLASPNAFLATAPVVSPDAARLSFEDISPLDSYRLPLGPFAGGAIATEQLEGRVARRVWRLDANAQTTLQILTPLRDKLLAAGYDIVFECRDRECGGFDFRVGTEVVPAPDMQVAIRDYRFLAARKDTGGVVTLLVSRSQAAGFVQIISVLPAGPKATPDNQPAPAVPRDNSTPDQPAAQNAPEGAAIPGQEQDDLAFRLLNRGHAILEGLAFAPGGSSLEEGNYASLARLAQFLADHPKLSVMLVGHTDSVGDLLANIRLSKRRAQAVRTRLIGTYDADPGRIRAEGNGYLSPVASNLTEAGREANRRVEAILLP